MTTHVTERGIARGDLVLGTAHNRPEWVFTWLACAYLGAIWVPTDPRATQAELDGLIGQVRPKLVVKEPLEGDAIELEHVADEDDAVVLIPTSGTTGRSKLVTQTQRAYAMAGEGFPYWMELGPDDRLMTSLPLFHINAPAYSILGSVGARASVVLLPRFSASTFIVSARTDALLVTR